MMRSSQTSNILYKKAYTRRNIKLLCYSKAHTRNNYSSGSSSTTPSISFKSLFSWYSNKLETHPLTTKCLTSGLISGSGDVCCQKLFKEEDKNNHKSKKEWDMIRTARMSFLGFALIAPVTHNWYSFLMRNIPGKTIKATIKRLSMDQLLFSPVFLSTWIYSNMTLQGFDSKAIFAQLKLDYWDMLKANWGLWVPAQTINLGIVPGRYQVLFGNMVGLLWSVYLSYKGGSSKGVKSGEDKNTSNKV